MASGPNTPGGARARPRSRPAAAAARSDRGRERARAAARARQKRERKPRSDLSARVIAAVPAIAVALFLVLGGWLVFALGLMVLGGVCLHELYGMYERAHPARLAGFLALAGLLAAALYGDQFQVLLVAGAAPPLGFALVVAGAR